MDHFTAHRLQFDVEVRTPLELNAHQGSALRGALYHALRGRFCTNQAAGECRFCPLSVACPVCTLVSTLNPDGERGQDAPRPYTVQPPPAEGAAVSADGCVRYEPGQAFSFGLTLFARALQLFPYVIMAVHGLEQGGIGRRVAPRYEGRTRGNGAPSDRREGLPSDRREGAPSERREGLPSDRREGGRRGQFTVRRVIAVNPLSGERRDVLRAGQLQVTVPDVPITHAQVVAVAVAADTRRVTLEFLTPTRLIYREQLVKPADLSFRIVLQRLLDRLERLSRDFSDTPLQVDFRALLAQADRVRLADNATGWVELSSYSTRQERATPISGLVGTATFEGDDLAPFLPWLIWGQFVHVGKDAVKGNGWYRLTLS